MMLDLDIKSRNNHQLLYIVIITQKLTSRTWSKQFYEMWHTVPLILSDKSGKYTCRLKVVSNASNPIRFTYKTTPILNRRWRQNWCQTEFDMFHFALKS